MCNAGSEAFGCLYVFRVLVTAEYQDQHQRGRRGGDHGNVNVLVILPSFRILRQYAPVL
jgi:hypothetical protein